MKTLFSAEFIDVRNPHRYSPLGPTAVSASASTEGTFHLLELGLPLWFITSPRCSGARVCHRYFQEKLAESVEIKGWLPLKDLNVTFLALRRQRDALVVRLPRHHMAANPKQQRHQLDGAGLTGQRRMEERD